jgi:hypothetical protein
MALRVTVGQHCVEVIAVAERSPAVVRVRTTEACPAQSRPPRHPAASSTSSKLWDWIDKGRAMMMVPALRRAVDRLHADEILRLELTPGR